MTAHYANGREREVTHLAHFESNKEALLEIDDGGVAKLSHHSGEAIVVARFLGQVATARVTVPPDETLPAEHYTTLPVANFIDEWAHRRFQKLGLFPSDPASASDFMRRVSIDLIGRLPSADEARAFITDDSPNKRQVLVERLLDHPGYADHWAVKWADLLRPNPDRAGVKSVYLLDQWLREAFRQNMPLDQFARELLTAQGSTHRHGPTVIYRDRRTPEDRATLVSQVLLGVRLECARCHHHPNEKWSQEDFYQLAAFFGQLKHKGNGVSPPISGGWEMIYHQPGGKVKHPVTQSVMTPRPPDGATAKVQDASDPRIWLADWLTEPNNPFFAKAMVNRVWAELMGRGIVHPVDDFRATNPATNPDLLGALADDFVANGYDLKDLIRTIVSSHLYQQSSTPTPYNLQDTENFSRSYRRRLAAEVLTDAVCDITGIANEFEGLPSASRANHVWNFKIASDTLDAFGRPDSSSDCPCERNLSTSVVQALHLMNSQDLQEKLSHESSRVSKLAAGKQTPEAIIEELYLLAYSRFPTDEERAIAHAEFEAEGATRQSAAEDVLWALLNSAEFVFNH